MKSDIRNITELSVFAALLAVSSWITIPFAVPFTMQTFAVFLACMYLGGKRAAICIAVYLFLGAVGLPVFSSFGAGIGALFGASGGYLWGFLLTALVYEVTVKLFGTGAKARLAGCAVGIILCYFVGTAWYALAYSAGDNVTFLNALAACVLPFILPDAVKLLLAFAVWRRLLRRLGAGT